MAGGRSGAVFHQIRRIFGAGSVRGLDEGQLLARFVETRDEAAFEGLVARFGPMVLGVCRQLIPDRHAAEDAFQATFLVLAKKAPSIRDGDRLGNWLYGVALKVAKRSRTDQFRRRSREEESPHNMPEPIGPGPSSDDPDLGPVLHEELSRLPEKYRAPVVLCYLEGRTYEEAARRLGWPVGTVKGRLSRAKDLLRERLGRRGVTASSTLLAAALAQPAEASVPGPLLDQTVKAAMALAAGGVTAAGLGSASAVALAEGVLATMTLSKWKLSAAAIVGLGLATGGIAMGMPRSRPAADRDLPVNEASKTPGEASRPEGPKLPSAPPDPFPREGPRDNPMRRSLSDGVDLIVAETPLPDEDVPLATLEANRVEEAKKALNVALAFYESGSIPLDRLIEAARAWMTSRTNAAADPAARIKAIEEYVRLMHALRDREHAKFTMGIGLLPSLHESELMLLDARILLAKARLAKTPEANAAPPEGR
jgi:RNA polymerase sigma factor (sigma-70 family)